MYSCRSNGCLNPCNVCCYFSSFGFSTSRWCSRGCDEENNFFPRPPRPCPCPCPCVSGRFAYLTQVSGMRLSAGESIPFTDTSLLGDGFQFANGVLLIQTPGIYRVDYRIHIPREASVDTTFMLQLAGAVVPGTTHTVCHRPGEPEVNISAQVIVQVSAESTLTLVTMNPLCIPACMTGDALVTMTVTGV